MFIDFFTIFLETSPARRPPYKPTLGGPRPPPEIIPAGENVNNAFVAIFLRNLFEIFENFLKIFKEFVFFVQKRKNWMLDLLNFFKNMINKSIFSIFVKIFFENFRNFKKNFLIFLIFLKIFCKFVKNFCKNFYKIFWIFFENFFENVFPPRKKSWLRPCHLGVPPPWPQSGRCVIAFK